MPSSATYKGFQSGWTPGETGWGTGVNEDLARADAFSVDHWAQERLTTVGLTYGYRGGLAIASGHHTMIATGVITLAASQTNYVERTTAGIVSSNTTGFTNGRIPLAKVVTGVAAINSVEDWRTISQVTYDQALAVSALTSTGLVTGSGFDLGALASTLAVSSSGISNHGAAGTLALDAGTGSSIDFYIGGTRYWEMHAGGAFLAMIDATYDIGQAGVNRPANIWIAGQYAGQNVALTTNIPGLYDAFVATNPNTAGGVQVRLVGSTISAEFGVTSAAGYTYFGSISAHDLVFVTNGLGRWCVQSAGHLIPEADASFDIGISGTQRPRNLFLSGNATLGGTIGVTGAATLGSISSAAATLTAITATSITVSTQASQSTVDLGTITGSPAINLTSANIFKATLGGNITPTFSPAGTAGAWYTLFLKQDATGSRTVTWPASVKWPGGSAPTLTLTAGKTDVFALFYDGTNHWGFFSGAAY